MNNAVCGKMMDKLRNSINVKKLVNNKKFVYQNQTACRTKHLTII